MKNIFNKRNYLAIGLMLLVMVAFFLTPEAGVGMTLAALPIWGLVSDGTFKELSVDEIGKLSEDDQKKYFADKAANAKKSLDDALEKQAEALRKEFGQKAFSVDSPEYKAMELQIKTMKENFDKSIEDLGKKKSEGIIGVNKKIGAEFQDLHKAKEAGTLDQVKSGRNEAFKIETKAFDSLNVHSVSSVSSGVYPENGTVSAVSSTYRTVYAQLLGMFDVPRVYSRIMDVVDIRPLVADTLIAFNRIIVNGFAITPECTEKPVSKIALSPQTVTADPVSSLFYTTLHLRAFYPALVNDFVNTFKTLLAESIPNYVMAQVRTNAVAYTPVASLEWPAPSYFEAIAATTASLKKLGYMPNMIALSPIDYALMITEIGEDGHYKLQNGSSIVLVGDTVKIGSTNLIVIEDAYLADGEFMLGDARAAVKVGLGTDVYYFETDGRTDNQNDAGDPPSTGLAVNVRTHELAQFVAVMLPTGSKGALVRDTFPNVITLITAGS